MMSPKIEGYTVTEQLSLSDRAVVYRAVQDRDRQPVVIKILRLTHPHPSELIQLRHQYTIALNLRIPGIVPPLGLVPFQKSYAFVMEDCGSTSLKEYQHSYTLSLSEILEITIQLAAILHDLAQHRVIHKDIKPANILIHPTTRQVKLIDFGIASLLPKETPEIVSPNRLEGTLAYIAPEQTGRMNRGVDYRADFYALGVTLYELLTQQLPFRSKDPIEVVYGHLAQQPIAVSQLRPELPLVLSDIVSKLMAKNAEERYQTALGLKYDLELCLSQWQEGAQIDRFEIATHDLGSRFSISEKLYGREVEVQTLLTAFARVGSPVEHRVAKSTAELILVSGLSGIGKTAIVNEVHKPITRQHGYFISGKFDQFNRNIPFAALIQAFRQLMASLLTSSDVQLQIWKSKILAALGENAQVIIEVIPELERIVGSQALPPELAGNAAQNRFNLLFQNFVRVFAQPEHPLVIFVDDLQWADSASLKLIQLLMDAESSTGYLLIIGAYRDNEVFPVHPLMLTLKDLRAAGVTINTIDLKQLDLNSLNRLVADTLLCDSELAMPLTELVYRYTKGNPFFATQFLKSLHQNGSISLDRQTSSWRFDLTQVRIDALTDDVVELMTQQLSRLPKSTQNLLQLAACIGNRFDLRMLAIVSEQTIEEVATNLWQALTEGLILPIGETYKLFQSSESVPINCDLAVSYKFLHDRVQQAAYSLISADLKQASHLKIGQLLLRAVSTSEREDRLFEIVNHLNGGISLITSAQEQEELAEFNLTAGRKAKVATAYSTAINYFSTGIALLPESAWESDYLLILALYQEVTEAHYLNSDLERMEQCAAVVLQQAKTLLDTISVQKTRIIGTKVQGKFFDAIKIGLEVLCTLGIEFSQQPTPADIKQAFEITKSLWVDKKPLSLLDLPTMSDPNSLATMEILTVLVSAAYVGAPKLMPLLIFKQVELSIQFGNCPVCVFTYADYGLILCGVIGDIDNGCQFGELSLSLLDRLQSKSMKARSWFINYGFIKHWKTNLAQVISSLEEAYCSGIETGDLESAALIAYRICNYLYHGGKSLTELAETLDLYKQSIVHHQYAVCVQSYLVMRQVVSTLRGETNFPDLLTGTYFDQETDLPRIQAENQRTALFEWHLNQTTLYYLFEKYQEAADSSATASTYLDGSTGTFIVVVYSFYDALIQLQLYATATTVERQSILVQVQQQQDKLDRWARLAPENHQHRWELVAAEQYRVLGNKVEAMESYDRAIIAAKTNGFIQDEAIANQLAAKFYLDWDKPKIAAIYMQAAYHCYRLWGAQVKTDDLEQRYPQLLDLGNEQSIHVQPLANTNPIDRVLITSNSASSSIDQDLDLAAILKASQSLSRTIDLQDLLHQLTQIILQNSGGDSCALIIPNSDEEWCLAALATPEHTTVCQTPLSGNPQIPVALIQYVKNSQVAIAIDNLDTDLPVIDEYLAQQQPQSILCLPILNQGELMGILYLENRSTSHVFTSDRIEILNLLCTQSAISLKNAQLYQQSQIDIETLRYTRSRLQSLSDNLPGVIMQICINPQTGSDHTSYISSGCYELYEVTAEEMMSGQYSQRDFEHPDDRDRIAQAIQSSAAQLIPFQEEFRIITFTGKIKWVQVASQPTRMSEDSIVWDGLVMDISDRKQAELQLKRTNEELIRATRLKDEFLATMSHELRTPLNAILGMTEGLTEQVFGTVNDRQIKALATIERSGFHLLELINDILDVAKIESGHLELECTPISVASICQSSLAFIKQQAYNKRITIETSMPPDLPDLMVDERRIRQVLINILSNAVKFTPAGGKINLSVEQSRSGFLKISITDTGIGISPENINKLFQPFIQIDSALNRQYEGTGLGLALVKRLIELHGGTVHLTSTVGQGSCVAIYLPCIESAHASMPTLLSATELHTSYQLSPLCTTTVPLILLAEDNSANISTICSYLEAKGFQMVVANNGAEAINLAQSAHPDLILMDIQMPGMNGIEAMEEIRRLPQFAKLPMIAVTALAMNSDRDRCLAAGANDYLSKPLNLKNLTQTIQTMLADRSANPHYLA